MNIDVQTTADFDRAFRRLAKRHRSLPQDLNQFVAGLRTQSISGTEIAPDVYKYRMGIRSKQSGKSGGARIITYEVVMAQRDKTITLLTIYDKSDQSSISQSEIDDLRHRAGL